MPMGAIIVHKMNMVTDVRRCRFGDHQSKIQWRKEEDSRDESRYMFTYFRNQKHSLSKRDKIIRCNHDSLFGEISDWTVEVKQDYESGNLPQW